MARTAKIEAVTDQFVKTEFVEPLQTFENVTPGMASHIGEFRNSMSSAPRDKRWIEASTDGKDWVRVRFYQTRIRTGAIQWIPVECWTTSDPPKFAGRVEGLTMWRETSQW